MGRSRATPGIHQSLESGLSSIVADIEALLADGWSGTAAERFRSHYEAVRSEAEKVLADGREIMARVPQAVNLLTATSAQWRGAAADAYQTSQADWTGRAREVLRHLEEIRQRITTARAAYQGANEANGKMFR
ncbi:WXG100 family type VII secretion target [Nocardia amikacinitolerans]|uniref:WXG100 family type VII secretion target n=1 Tax=Nocardia amikacinitolerans TaxID=756689 RepID=UPI0036A9E3EC